MTALASLCSSRSGVASSAGRHSATYSLYAIENAVLWTAENTVESVPEMVLPSALRVLRQYPEWLITNSNASVHIEFG